jgi:hypothetical protein
LSVCIPESPRWYLRVGKRDKAAKVLQRLNGKIPGYDIERELDFMTYELTGELDMLAESAKVSYLELFRGSNLRRTLVSFSVLGWQQCIGIAVVVGPTFRRNEDMLIGSMGTAQSSLQQPDSVTHSWELSLSICSPSSLSSPRATLWSASDVAHYF